jgi:hypothetical protein
MDVLSIFENILYQYTSTIGLKPVLTAKTTVPTGGVASPQSRVLYLRTPEPPASTEYSVDKLELSTNILSTTTPVSRSSRYVQEDVYDRIPLEILIA